MRIYWQSFVDTKIGASYLQLLETYLNRIAAPGCRVEVFGMTPPDRDFGRLAEFRCAILAVDNGLAAEEAGYDGYVMGHFQDPGLYALRSALRIPVVGAGEATLHAAAQLGRRLGMVSLDPVFEVWHHEQAELYGLAGRISGVTGMGCHPADFNACFAGDLTVKEKLLRDFTNCARPLVQSGADVIIPAGVLPGMLLGGEHGYRVDHAPVVNCAAIALKSAEMWVQLRQMSGLEPSRGASFALAGETAKRDFRQLVRHGRQGVEQS